MNLTSSRRSYRPVVIFAATVEPQKTQKPQKRTQKLSSSEDVSEKGADIVRLANRRPRIVEDEDEDSDWNSW